MMKISKQDGLKYNATPIYSLGLRQNLIYEKKFENFSRKGVVSDEPSEYIKEVNKYKREVELLPARLSALKKIDRI